MKHFYAFKLDAVNQRLWSKNWRVPLTPKAFALLHYLVENQGQLVSQAEVFEALWPETYVQPEVLKSHIRDIRRALGDDPRKPIFIETLPRRGYRFLAPVTDPERPNPEGATSYRTLIGRQREQHKLDSYFARAMRGERQTVFVSGEAGIGKTILLDSFIMASSKCEPRLRVGRGQCSVRRDPGEPYAPVLEAIWQLCRNDCGRGIARLLQSAAPNWLAQLPALARQELGRINTFRDSEPNRARMLREFCDWVEMLTAERPLLLVLDDLQLADEATVELISALARRRGAAKLLLAGTYRPEDACLTDGLLETVKRDLVLRRLAEEIELELLTQEETVEYAARSSLHTVTEATHRFLFRYSEGNPRFLSALIEELLSDNPDLTDLSTATTTDCISTFPLRIPNGIRKQFETRIAQVSSPGRRAIEAACIFGSSFITSHAAEVARLDPEMFEDLCEPMIAGGVIGREGCDRLPNGALTQRYRFRHLLYREILYGMLPLERRSRLHQRAAVYIEALYAGRLEEGSIATLHTV